MKPLEQITNDLTANVKYAEDQDEYLTLHAHKYQNGLLAIALELSDEEIEEIVKTKKLYMSVHTFDQPLQPFFVTGKQETFNEHLKIYTE
ncbi:MAG: hypothetical protein RR571_09290 [Anaerorhabdus sp.]|uniref:hypothetical protein n=1 Tax=Anaerorhabdus sp. TaxID=1872524 RepID=UPI002FC7E286